MTVRFSRGSDKSTTAEPRRRSLIPRDSGLSGQFGFMLGVPAGSSRDGHETVACGDERPASTALLHPDSETTSGRLGRSCRLRESPATTGVVRGFPVGMSAFRARDERRMRRDRRSSAPLRTTEHGDLQGLRGRKTGATGLEPATSGVTGRSWCLRDRRESAGISAMSGTFRLASCGDRRVPAGVSADLPRDVRGMVRCLNRKLAGCLRDECVRLVLQPTQGQSRRRDTVPAGGSEPLVDPSLPQAAGPASISRLVCP